MKLVFVTGNPEKFAVAKTLCEGAGIELTQAVFDIDEIQGDNPELIVRDKARKAYELVKQPLIVSDDSWDILGLNGFPGAYMKDVSHWFTPQNFIDLMANTSDRTAILHQYLAYQDENETILFTRDQKGRIVAEPKGSHPTSWLNVIALDADDGETLAEIATRGQLNDPEHVAKRGDVWEDAIAWLKSQP